jgi:hypothetical protein
MGRYRATFETSVDDSQCASHSYGAIHQFFITHQRRSLTRGFVELRDKKYMILITIATIDMPDYATATELHTLLFDTEMGASPSYLGNGDDTAGLPSLTRLDGGAGKRPR